MWKLFLIHLAFGLFLKFHYIITVFYTKHLYGKWLTEVIVTLAMVKYYTNIMYYYVIIAMDKTGLLYFVRDNIEG